MSFWSMKTGKPFTEWRSFSDNQNNRATNWFDHWLPKQKKELTQISIHYVIHDDQHIVLSLTQTTRSVIIADIPFALSIRFSVIENIFSQKMKMGLLFSLSPLITSESFTFWVCFQFDLLWKTHHGNNNLLLSRKFLLIRSLLLLSNGEPEQIYMCKVHIL